MEFLKPLETHSKKLNWCIVLCSLQQRYGKSSKNLETMQVMQEKLEVEMGEDDSEMLEIEKRRQNSSIFSLDEGKSGR